MADSEFSNFVGRENLRKIGQLVLMGKHESAAQLLGAYAGAYEAQGSFEAGQQFEAAQQFEALQRLDTQIQFLANSIYEADARTKLSEYLANFDAGSLYQR